MGDEQAAPEAPDARRALLELCPKALPQVYGYLMSRCGRQSLAEDLTAETLLAAVNAVRLPSPPPVSIPWLVGVARHKLADHWRREARDARKLVALAFEATEEDDPWDVHLDNLRARATIANLLPDHQAVLTLRYIDDLPVGEVGRIMDKTVHATEGLLTRAKAAFRARYEEVSDA